MSKAKPGTLSANVSIIPHAEHREWEQVSMRETFNQDFGFVTKGGKVQKDANGDPVPADRPVNKFKEPGPLTPEINEDYVFNKADLIMFMLSVHQNESIYLQGHSGTGKTEMVNQIAARLNYNVVQVNFDGHLLRSDLVGEVRIANGATEFRYGLIPLGYCLPGTILLLDEVDACAPETAFVIQRAVSQERKMLLHETNELIHLHPQNALVATANTMGMGDESSLYLAGTNVQNFSFQNRWDTVMQIDYIEPALEEEMLRKRFPKMAKNDPVTINKVVSVMDKVRTSYKAGKFTAPLTIRDSIRWLRKLSRWPLPLLTAEYSFLNRLDVEDALAIAKMIESKFTIPPKDSQKFLVRSSSSGSRSI